MNDAWKCPKCSYFNAKQNRECPCCGSGPGPQKSESTSDSWFSTDNLISAVSYEPSYLSAKDRVLVEKNRADLLRDVMDFEERRKSPGTYYVRKTTSAIFSLVAWIFKGIVFLTIAALIPAFATQCQRMADGGEPGYYPTYQEHRR